MPATPFHRHGGTAEVTQASQAPGRWMPVTQASVPTHRSQLCSELTDEPQQVSDLPPPHPTVPQGGG